MIIPARGGSKGLPGKNIKKLKDKHLIGYTIEAAKKSKYVNRIVVSTDDTNIAEISKIYGAEIPCMRPSSLSGDTSPTIDSVVHMIKYLEENEKYSPDYIMLLQCTSPLRTSDHIDAAVEELFKSKYDGIVSVCEAEVHPYWTNIFNGDKLEPFIKTDKAVTRRQDLPKVYRLNGAIYLIKKDILLKEKTFQPHNLTGFIMDEYSSVDIDTKFDFKIAELLLEMKENN